MADEKDQQKLYLEEYKEAASQCRHFENLTRTSWQISFSVSVALIGAVLSEIKLPVYIKIVGSVLGFLFCASNILILNRLRWYYIAYMIRMRSLEKLLGFSLYTEAGRKVRRLHIFGKRVPITNKTVPIYLLGILCILFLLSIPFLVFRGTGY